MEQLKKYFKENFNIERDWELFESKLVPQQFSKNETILRAGETEKYLSFVENGIIRQYIPKIENDLTFGFAFQGSFISAYDSFLTKTPCKYNVETLTKAKLWRLSYEDLQLIYDISPIGNLIGRKASEGLFLKKSQREISLLNDPPEVRYIKLFSERPELIQKISLKYIASYIGVTPQALSRIRKRIS